MKTKVSYIPYAILNISRTIAFKDLVDQIKSLNLHQEKIREASMIECSGSQIKRITQDKIDWLNFAFYKSSRSKHNIDAIINSYFCVSRDRMLQSVRTALADNRNWNALLYGPPGTGKSCFATLLAKVLERNIVSVDLRLMNRSQLLTTLFAEDYKRKIFILEEFDNTVREFVRRERETKLMEIDGKLIRPPPDPNVLHLTDLLEIFQGPIPRPKMIIIATTNDLEYIQGTRSDSDFEGLPALIRPGRLTPWYIGYVNNEILAQIIRFYFPTVEHIDFNLPSFHQVSTCAIVEYAKASLGDYELFKKWLIQDVEK
jgi:Cdc6-like AAA superfamily ATPase